MTAEALDPKAPRDSRAGQVSKYVATIPIAVWTGASGGVR
jgi:hypothetical protein